MNDDFKALYQIAKTIDPGVAVQLAMQVETEEERNFFIYISNMNLQRAQ